MKSHCMSRSASRFMSRSKSNRKSKKSPYASHPLYQSRRVILLSSAIGLACCIIWISPSPSLFGDAFSALALFFFSIVLVQWDFAKWKRLELEGKLKTVTADGRGQGWQGVKKKWWSAKNNTTCGINGCNSGSSTLEPEQPTTCYDGPAQGIAVNERTSLLSDSSNGAVLGSSSNARLKKKKGKNPVEHVHVIIVKDDGDEPDEKWPNVRIMVCDFILAALSFSVYTTELSYLTNYYWRYSGSGPLAPAYASVCTLVAGILHARCGWYELITRRKQQWERERSDEEAGRPEYGASDDDGGEEDDSDDEGTVSAAINGSGPLKAFGNGRPLLSSSSPRRHHRHSPGATRPDETNILGRLQRFLKRSSAAGEHDGDDDNNQDPELGIRSPTGRRHRRRHHQETHKSTSIKPSRNQEEKAKSKVVLTPDTDCDTDTDTDDITTSSSSTAHPPPPMHILPMSSPTTTALTTATATTANQQNPFSIIARNEGRDGERRDPETSDEDATQDVEAVVIKKKKNKKKSGTDKKLDKHKGRVVEEM